MEKYADSPILSTGAIAGLPPTNHSNETGELFCQQSEGHARAAAGLARAADVWACVFNLQDMPEPARKFVMALAGAMDGKPGPREVNGFDIGRRYVKGPERQNGATLGRRAERGRAALELWQNESGWRDVTWTRGGGQTATGRHPATSYTAPLFAVVAEVYSEARKSPRWADPRKRPRLIESIARPRLARLHAPEVPVVTERDDVRYPDPNNTMRHWRNAASQFVAGLDKSPDPEPGLAEFWRIVAPKLRERGLMAEAPELDELGSIDHGNTEGDRLSPEPEPWPNLEPEDEPESPHILWSGEPNGINDLQGGILANPATVFVSGQLVEKGGYPSPKPEPVMLSPEVARLREARHALWTFRAAGAERFKVVYRDDASEWREALPELASDPFAYQLPELLRRAVAEQLSMCVRVYGAGIVQLDDCSAGDVERLGPFAFLTVQTSPSPSGHQVWLQLGDGEPKDVRARLLAGLGSATANAGPGGSLRFPGSDNHKPERRRPDGSSPMVRVLSSEPGRVVTVAELATAGLLAEPERPEPLPPVPPPGRAGASPEARGWPDYARALADAPKRADGKPDRSRADFAWCLMALGRGWPADAVAAQLAELSERARGGSGSDYVARTVARAVARAGA